MKKIKNLEKLDAAGDEQKNDPMLKAAKVKRPARKRG